MSFLVSIYLLGLALALIGGLGAIVRDPALLVALRVRVATRSTLLVVGFCLAGAGAIIAADLTGQLVISGLAGALSAGTIMHLLIAVGIAPQSASWAGEAWPGREPWTIRTAVTWIAITLAWSWLSLLVIESLIDFRVQEGFLLKDATAARPFEFLAIACFALTAAIAEEWIFRGYLQPLITRTSLGKWGGILIPSLIWIAGHSGYIEPVGIKELQLLGLGIILGLARHRYGLGAAILLHLANNGTALLVAALFPELQW